jgi:hypothetical protein
VGQEANISAYIVHDDHIFPFGAGDPNHRRKDAGKASEAHPAQLSGYTGAVSRDLSGPESRLRSIGKSFNNSRTVGIIQPGHD